MKYKKPSEVAKPAHVSSSCANYTTLSLPSPEHTFVSEQTHAFLLHLSLRNMLSTLLMCLYSFDYAIHPFYFLMRLQKGPKEVRSHVHEAPMGNAHIIPFPWGKTSSWLLCASPVRSREVLILSPLQEERSHSFTVPRMLEKDTMSIAA